MVTNKLWQETIPAQDWQFISSRCGFENTLLVLRLVVVVVVVDHSAKTGAVKAHASDLFVFPQLARVSPSLAQAALRKSKNGTLCIMRK